MLGRRKAAGGLRWEPTPPVLDSVVSIHAPRAGAQGTLPPAETAVPAAPEL